MAIIKKCRGLEPKIDPTVYLAEGVVIVGDVEIGENSSVWWNAVVRGDVNSIRIGRNCNIQDGAIIHCTYQKASTIIEDEVSVGHNAIIHGCTLKTQCLVGMGATVMDNAIIESNAIVAAGAVVLEGTRVESGFIYAGVPAKKVKRIEGELLDVFEKTSKNYMLYKSWFEE